MSYDWESNCGYKPIAQWVRVRDGKIPNNAVAGGQDLSGENLFVGRVEHQGDVIPGKIVASQGVCFVPYGGKEHVKSDYQVLVHSLTDEDIVWKDASYGDVPTGAIQGGVTADGERLYIGRVKHMGAMCVGKIHPSHQVCFVSFDGQEYSYSLYVEQIFGTVRKIHSIGSLEVIKIRVANFDYYSVHSEYRRTREQWDSRI